MISSRVKCKFIKFLNVHIQSVWASCWQSRAHTRGGKMKWLSLKFSQPSSHIQNWRDTTTTSTRRDLCTRFCLREKWHFLHHFCLHVWLHIPKRARRKASFNFCVCRKSHLMNIINIVYVCFAARYAWLNENNKRRSGAGKECRRCKRRTISNFHGWNANESKKNGFQLPPRWVALYETRREKSRDFLRQLNNSV